MFNGRDHVARNRYQACLSLKDKFDKKVALVRKYIFHCEQGRAFLIDF